MTFRGEHGFREEVLNVKLAEVLARREILSVPETILTHIPAGRRLPDLIVATYLGIIVIIEGKIGDTPDVRSSLERSCRNRIDEGVGSIVMGVIYPSVLRFQKSLEELENALEESELDLKVFTEGEESDWISAGVSDLAQILSRCYENLIKEDVVMDAVSNLQDVIERVLPLLAMHTATEERLREILIVPRRE